MVMRFDPQAYGPEIAAILAIEGNGGRLMALAEPRCVSEDARARIALAKLPGTLRAGLYLYFGCWTDAHEAAQAVNTREGSYWHAIAHRQDPDAANAAYWFGQVGDHPIFGELEKIANDPALTPWNSHAFTNLCERARRDPGSALERRAMELQRAEWQLLFDYCAKDAAAV
jgi:hypothetical protein